MQKDQLGFSHFNRGLILLRGRSGQQGQYRNAVASGRCELGMLLDEVDPTLPRVGTDLIAT